MIKNLKNTIINLAKKASQDDVSVQNKNLDNVEMKRLEMNEYY